ncbi:hypothetical protein Micbo1qcDRAFT_175000 [Microdochium bolleyi]|uniref:Uncharacterized protein n=1 Tax=Microdochium bolleyi TaxID=196109 RepID=A0A136J429_9PEZI|nr:hypothetical protein Micbo1qcDRAFT_175000 [Microdochium bolleyi]
MNIAQWWQGYEKAHKLRRPPKNDNILNDHVDDDTRSALEHQAEEQAEYELAHAGRNFDEHYSWTGSATSASASPSILTGSVVSIESYTSDDDLSSQCFSPTEEYQYVDNSDDEDLAVHTTPRPRLSRILGRLGSRHSSNGSSGDFYPPHSSSLIAHSGHSSEDFPINMDRLRERLGGRFWSRESHTPAR